MEEKWEVKDIEQPESAKQAINWFENKISKTITEIDKSYSQYRISEALMGTYKLVWDDFCSWYLEIVKPNYGNPIDKLTYDKTIEQLEILLKLLHPFMPFLSEEVWHLIDEKKEDLIVADWPKSGNVEEILLDDFDTVSEVVSLIRNFRKQKQIASIDVKVELEKLKKELEYTEGFLKSVEAKLSNEKFVKNAPQSLVDKERKKQADAKAKIEILADKITALSHA